MALQSEEASWESAPNIYEVVSLFKSEQAAIEVTLMEVVAGRLPVRNSYFLDPATAKLLMKNVQILNSRTFAQDGELEHEIIAMKDSTH